MPTDSASLCRLLAIDGPAGCGKSTVAKSLAQRLGGVAFGTGVIYRVVTYLGLQAGVDLADTRAVLGVLRDSPLSLEVGAVELQLVVRRAGQDPWMPGPEVHEPAVTREIHWVADAPSVRAALLPIQRDLPSGRLIVAEGRDLGTVVYPSAPVKVFLTASVEERARRRLRDWRAGRSSEALDLESVIEDLEARDRRDRDRAVAPLRKAPDAHVVDSTGRDVLTVVQEIMQWVPKDWVPGD